MQLFATLLLSVLLLWLVFRTVRILRRRTGGGSTVEIPPGSLGLPWIGETVQFMAAINSTKGFYDFVYTRRLRYGNCFKTSIVGETHVFVSSTEWAKSVLNNDLGKFTKRYLRSIAEVVGDRSLLCASDQHHRFLRSRLNSLFTTGSLSLFITQFDELVVGKLSRWEWDSVHGGTVIVLHEALEITFKAMCKMLMSLEDENKLKMLQKDVSDVCQAMLSIPLKLPFTRFHKGIQARKRIMSTLEKMISERRRRTEAYYHEDFLQQLVMVDNKTCCSNGAPVLTDQEIKDNILTMIIAGQDTTASAITWMVKYLDENQEVLNTLRGEQFSVKERGMKNSYNLTLEDLNHMPFASKVVKESLRLGSVVPWFPRLALQDCEIQGYKIKKGWNVNVDARSIHLDPTLFDDPHKFIPSRFQDESKAYSFLAFGSGGRTCLGLNLARVMMLVFLHRLVTTYKWKVIDSDSSIEKWALFSRLKTGCPIHVTPMANDYPTID